MLSDYGAHDADSGGYKRESGAAQQADFGRRVQLASVGTRTAQHGECVLMLRLQLSILRASWSMLPASRRPYLQVEKLSVAKCTVGKTSEKERE